MGHSIFLSRILLIWPSLTDSCKRRSGLLPWSEIGQTRKPFRPLSQYGRYPPSSQPRPSPPWIRSRIDYSHTDMKVENNGRHSKIDLLRIFRRSEQEPLSLRRHPAISSGPRPRCAFSASYFPTLRIQRQGEAGMKGITGKGRDRSDTSSVEFARWKALDCVPICHCPSYITSGWCITIWKRPWNDYMPGSRIGSCART